MSSNSGKGIIQIEKSIHDYMVNSISYDYEALRNKSMNRCSFNIYGVINNRLAVCEGIAKFVKLTLNKLGIECFICGGKCILENEKIEDHAWNVIKIEEDYYHIDVTWDIRRDDAQNKRIVPYDYFNLDDANISRDHFDFNMSFECTSMLYNYHAIMGRFISGKKQLIQLLSDGLALGKDFSFRIKRTINTPDNIDDIVVETFNESVKYNGTNGKQYYLSANKKSTNLLCYCGIVFSELERLEGYYQIMGFLNGVKEVFSIGSTLDRMNQGIDGVVNYKSCSVENFFESQYGTINTIVSGGSDDIRFKVLRAHIAIAINDGFPVIVLHQGNPYIGSRLRNEFGGVVETNIVDIGSACYDPFYDLDGGAISELVMGAAPKSFDIKHNAKYYIEGVVELLKKSKKKPYFNLLATCPHTTLFDKINDLVGKNQISDSDGQEIKSKLMIGQSESVKIESYFYTLQTQIQPFLYRTKSREKPVNVRKNISNKELLVINIGEYC